MNIYSSFSPLFKRKNGLLLLLPFCFFGVSFFLLSLGLDSNTSDALMPKIFWTLTLFTTILSVESTFQEEWERGILDLWVLYPFSFSQLILLQLVKQFFCFSLPLMGMGLLFSFLYGFSLPESLWFLASLALGTPSLILMGLMISCLKLGSRGGVVLMVLILFPLYIPILILGLQVPEAVAIKGNPWIGIKGLFGLLLLNILSCTVLGGWSLRSAVMR